MSGATMEEILEQELPDLGSDVRGWLLWNRTGFPCFFHGRTDEEIEAELRRQLRKAGEWVKGQEVLE